MITESEIQSMGAQEAIRRKHLVIAAKDASQNPAVDFLLVLASDTNRACTHSRLTGQMSGFSDRRSFNKVADWYETDRFDNTDPVLENKIRAMGAREAIRQGHLKVIGKDTNKYPATAYLLMMTGNPTRGCTWEVYQPGMSKFDDLQLFYKFGAWYDADHIEIEEEAGAQP